MLNDLPIDIIYRIQRIYTARIDSNIVEWRRAVLLLIICRRWRAVAKGILYAYVYIGNFSGSKSSRHILDRDTFEIKGRYSKTWSNLGLVVLSGSCDKVRGLHICTLESKHYISPLLYCIYTLSLSDKEYPEIELLEAAAHAMEQRLPIDQSDKYDCYLAATNIGHVIARKLPNVSRLIISSLNANRTLLSFYVALIERYIGQLKSLEYGAPGYFPIPWASTNLESLELFISNFHADSSPLINPRHHKTLYLFLGDVQFQWNWFHWNKTANIIVFENLEKVYILRDTYNSLDDVLSTDIDNKNMLELQFPKLTTLYDLGSSLSLHTIESMLDGGLIRLTYAGFSRIAQQICYLNISKLQYFNLHFYQNCESYNDEFVEATNSIFQLTHNLKFVVCSVDLVAFPLKPTQIYWPFLHRIFITEVACLALVLELIPCWPNLTTLGISVEECTDDYLNNFRDEMMDLKQTHTEPSLSIVDILCINFVEQPAEYFAPAFPALKWFFPRLKHLDIDGIEVKM